MHDPHWSDLARLDFIYLTLPRIAEPERVSSGAKSTL